VIAATIDGDGLDEGNTRRAAAAIKGPTLVIHGDEDAISSVSVSRELALLLGAELAILPGPGHEPHDASRSPSTRSSTRSSSVTFHRIEDSLGDTGGCDLGSLPTSA
jgi:hypothetical protein